MADYLTRSDKGPSFDCDIRIDENDQNTVIFYYGRFDHVHVNMMRLAHEVIASSIAGIDINRNTKFIFQSCTFDNCLLERLTDAVRFRNSRFNACTFDSCDICTDTFDAHCRLECNCFDMCEFYIVKTIISRFSRLNTEVNPPLVCGNSAKRCYGNVEGLNNLSRDLGKNIEQSIPSEGSFIGWKKAYIMDDLVGVHVALVKLEITSDAQRLIDLCGNCRCSEAKVIAIYAASNPFTLGRVEGNVWKEYNGDAYSSYDSSFKYTVGKIIHPDEYDDDPMHICSHGIHFFMDPDRAALYHL